MAGQVLRAVEEGANRGTLKLEQWLRENGYVPCSPNGIAGDEKDESLRNLCFAFGVRLGEEVGVLVDDPTIKARTGFFGLFGPRRRRWVGTIWLDNPVRKANGSTWVFEAHGYAAEPIAEKLAKELAEAFHVDIRLVVINDCQYEVMGAHELP